MRTILKCIAVAAAVVFCAALPRPGFADDKPLPYMDYTLTPEKRAADLVSRLTNEEKVSLLSETAEEIPRLGVMRYYHGNEALHGVVRPGNATVFPMAIALASTWDAPLILRVATAISDEARGKDNGNNRQITNLYSGLLTFWSPTINMARDPRWGRTPETYGEDPFLTSRIGVNFVRGLQGDDPKYIKVVSTPKHFAANNEEHNRMECNAKMSDRALREYYLPAFRYLITEGKAESIMGAYNAINGSPCNANKMLLTDILRNEWGFDGYVVTDCGAVQNLIQWHKVAKNGTEAAALALNAGVDLECGGDAVMKNRLLSSLATGLVTQEAIDMAAYRVLRGRFRLGMFDPPEMVPYTKIPASVLGSPEHQKLALETARESIVLLQNRAIPDGTKLLPIDAAKVKTVAVMGPNAPIARFGDYSGSSVIKPITPLDGIKDRAAGRVEVNYIPWIPAPNQNDLTAIPAEMLKPDGMDGAGMKGEYFANTKMSGEPATVRVDEKADVDTANHAPDPGIPHGGFSARWTATLTPAMSGNYVLGFTTEGGATLIVDGETLLEKAAPKKDSFKAGQSFNIVKSGVKIETLTKNIKLEAGRQYKVEFDYMSAGGSAVAKLLWIAPAADREKARREAFDAAAKADVVVAVMGIGLDQEREGVDRDTLDLPADQRAFLAELTSRNPRTVLVLVSGSQLTIGEEIKEAPAVVEAWYGGESGGAALADVLFGNYNPAGRLPLTFYKTVEELPPFDDYEVSKGRTYMYSPNEPLFAFGHGLSYTTFDYSGISADKSSVAADGVVNVSFDVKNSGGLAGDEVAQLYVKPLNPPVKMPNIMLRGFTRARIDKGETKHVTIPLDVKELAYWNVDGHKFVVAPGKYEVLVGASSRDIRLRTTIEVK